MTVTIAKELVSSIQAYQGDCLTIMEGFAPSSFDLILVDPPFGITNAKGDFPIPLEPMWKQYARILKPTGCVVMFGVQPFTSKLILSNEAWYKQCLVWNKNKCGSPGLANVRPMQIHEDIVVFAPGKTTYNPIMETGEPYARKTSKPEGYVGKANTHGYGLKPVKGFTNTGTRFPKSIINISRDFSAQQQVHPHQKPVPLLEYLIKTYSHKGDTVLDNCMGSGSCGLAAKATGRRFVGIEKDSEYYVIAKGRLGLTDGVL